MTAAPMRIMLVDDHPLVRRCLADILARAFPHAAIEEVGCGADALGLVRTESWDIVILDLTLPDGSGLDVLRGIRELETRLPVLILSMHPADQFARLTTVAGASGYVTKEMAHEALVPEVMRLLFGGKVRQP